ncbi:caspase family protein [Stieleria varia]|uniref:Caspase domain protein n=1 Tax=Stieleria varia TaxID=2528005 RepID=A0A5C6B447_9BACT|nr:caspase family protein [Stieleria varia]TWU06261.1 Caspase domain protein [Stieleria varia]
MRSILVNESRGVFRKIGAFALLFGWITCVANPLAIGDDYLPAYPAEPQDDDGYSFFTYDYLSKNRGEGVVSSWYSVVREMSDLYHGFDFNPSSTIVPLGSDKIAFCFGDTLAVWDIVRGEEVWKYNRPLKPTYNRGTYERWQIAAPPSGEYLYSAVLHEGKIIHNDHRDHRYSDFEQTRGIAVWETRTGEQIANLEPDSRMHRLVSPRLSADGTTLVALQHKDRIDSAVVFETKTHQKIRTIPFSSTDISDMAYPITGRFLTASGKSIGIVLENGWMDSLIVDVYSTTGEGEKQRIKIPCLSGKGGVCNFKDLAIDPSGQFIATRHIASNDDDFVVLRDAKSLQEIRRWTYEDYDANDWSEISFDQDGHRLAFTHDNGPSTVVVDTRSGEILYRAHSYRSVFAREGSRLVGFETKCVCISDSQDGRILGKIYEPLVPSASILFSPRKRFSAPDSLRSKLNDFASNNERYVRDGITPARIAAFFDSYNKRNEVFADLNGVRDDAISSIGQGYEIPSCSISTIGIHAGKARIQFDAKCDSRTTLAKVSVRVVESLDRNDVWTSGGAQSLSNQIAETIELPIPTGKQFVTVEVRATDSLGGECVPKRQRVEVKETGGSVRGNRLLAVTIGVSDYAFDEFDLQYAASDATEIGLQLRKLEGTSFGSVVTEVLVDKQATVPNIRKAFHWLSTTCQSDDVALVFISGHGLKGRRGLYYLPHEGDPESIQSTCLNWEELAGLMGNLNAKTVLCLTDVCHAGAIGESSLEMQADSVKALQGKSNIVIGASSQGEAFSLELDELKHGAFAAALLAALQGKADGDGDGAITPSELDRFCTQLVKSSTRGRQVPKFLYDDKLGRSPLVDGLTRSLTRKVLQTASAVKRGEETISIAPAGSTVLVEREQGSWSLGVVEAKGIKTKGWVRTSDLKEQ